MKLSPKPDMHSAFIMGMASSARAVGGSSHRVSVEIMLKYYSLNLILVKECAPSPAALGVANGVTQFAQCVARAMSPAFVR